MDYAVQLKLFRCERILVAVRVMEAIFFSKASLDDSGEEDSVTFSLKIASNNSNEIQFLSHKKVCVYMYM